MLARTRQAYEVWPKPSRQSLTPASE